MLPSSVTVARDAHTAIPLFSDGSAGVAGYSWNDSGIKGESGCTMRSTRFPVLPNPRPRSAYSRK
eukprot:6203391-Pleurochrysis_carterae.AAC.3